MAKILNADEITQVNIKKAGDKTLLNIVEEMTIASRMRMPRVFVMRNENGINAMASGENFGRDNERMAIFVTKGAMKTFNRDEMQGVIGHEFSHAFHDDIELNIKLISVISALTMISTLGAKIMSSFKDVKIRRSRNTKSSRISALLFIFLFSLILFILGFIGTFFASIIQSAISRQKEFLADATSVKYTRNPNAIKNALQKLLNIQRFGRSYNDGIYYRQNQGINNNHKNFTIFFEEVRSFIGSDDEFLNLNYNNFAIQNLNAKQCSHMFFLPAFSSIFATHPSLENRIKNLKDMGAY
ncbi:MAG: M48 family metalloprotease, partial [Campylobacter sp.]|nr:M48 family metalloprotease [Campylobacter sp.]